MNNRILVGSVIFICIVLLFIIGSNSSNTLELFITQLIDAYLYIPKLIVNKILASAGSAIHVGDNKILFDDFAHYVSNNQDILHHWKDYVLFKKWSAFVVILIWGTIIPIKKKLFYTVLFVIVHQLSILSGLFILTLLGPVLVGPDSLTELRPNFIGALLFISLTAYFVKQNLPEIKTTLSKIKINLTITQKKLNELIILFFIFSLLRNFIVPYINFFGYIDFLLTMTQLVVSWFGYTPLIDGPYLVGENGTLYMAKWCLGFITMFVFASLVFVTGKKDRTSWIYILSGIVFLHMINIIRLAVLFIFVQRTDDLNLAYDHHDIYNIVIYVIIFVLWIIWFEKFTSFRKSISPVTRK